MTERVKTIVECVNCRASVDTATICAKCGLDPRVPHKTMEEYVRRMRWSPSVKGPAEWIAVEGESVSLCSAVAFTIAGAAIAAPLAPLGVGIVALLSVGALLHFRIREARDRARLARVGGAIHPRVSNLAQTACFRLDMPMVDVYVDREYELNAHAVGFWGRHWVVLQSALFDVLKDDELLFVIGHELGHIRRNHTTWLTLTGQHRGRSLPVLSQLLAFVFNRWLLKAEYSADRAGLLACRDEQAAIRALVRIHYWEQEVDVAELMKSFERDLRDPLLRIAENFGSHPYLANRIKCIRDFSEILSSKGVL